MTSRNRGGATVPKQRYVQISPDRADIGKSGPVREESWTGPTAGAPGVAQDGFPGDGFVAKTHSLAGAASAGFEKIVRA